MSNPLAAPFAAPATGSLGTSVPSQSAVASDPTTTPSLTQAYNSPTRVQRYLDKAKGFFEKYKWLIVVAVAAIGVWFFSAPGKSALCSNFGIACDTRPLPGGVREV